MGFNPNPEAEVRVEFDVLQPSTQRMRIVDVNAFDAKSGNRCLKVELEFVDPTALMKVDGVTPATNPGHLFDSGVVLEAKDPSMKNPQGKLRTLIEACGIEWASLAPSDDEDVYFKQLLVGKELDVKNKLGKDMDGNQRTEVGRYVIPEQPA